MDLDVVLELGIIGNSIRAGREVWVVCQDFYNRGELVNLAYC